MSKIIALTGAKGCGKDTVADILLDAYSTTDRPFRRIAFADPIKREIMHIFGLKTIAEYDAFKRSILVSNSTSVDGRRVVREIGMLMRKYDVNQFVEYVDERIASEDAVWVITDLRFDNELIHLQNLGAKIVKIDRPLGIIDTHITERGFDNSVCNLVLENKSTLREFTDEVLKAFDKKLQEWNWL
jgi:hypothetical protein